MQSNVTMSRDELTAAQVGLSDADIANLDGWLGRTEGEILAALVGELIEALGRRIDQNITAMARMAGRTDDDMRQIVLGVCGKEPQG